MKPSFFVNIVVILLVILFFTVICIKSMVKINSNSDKFTISDYLPDEGTVIEADFKKLHNLLHTLDNFRYTSKSINTKKVSIASRILVEDYTLEFPIRLLVNTKAKIFQENGFIKQSLERISP